LKNVEEMNFMKKFLLLLMLVIPFTIQLQAEEKEKKEFGIDVSGFIRADVIYDTRQSVTIRENAIMLYPREKDMVDGKDINDNPKMNMLVLHTRIRAGITGPDALGAKTSGLIEGEFFGAANDDANGFRLRHAFIKLDWGNTNLMFGQYWNPMFITRVLPSYNFDSPFIPYGRRPQIRLEQIVSNFHLIGTVSMFSDFSSIGPGPEGKPIRSTEFMANAAVPAVNFTAYYDQKDFVLGAGVDYKTIRPVLANENTLTSLSFTGFARYDIDDLSVKAQAVYGQNLNDVIMIGGYARQIEDNTKYENMNIFSAWTEFVYGKDIKVALLLGYTQNMGTDKDVLTNDPSQIWAMGWNVNEVLRISPSIQYRVGKVRLIAEVDYNQAIYGTPNEMYEFNNRYNVENLRYNFVAYYYF
jgi:hypothetical protein